MSANFMAFATTNENDGKRTPIHAERIVVVLGKDDEGRPLEISIYLEPPKDQPEALSVCAIEEPWPRQLGLPWTHSPELIIDKPTTTWNTCRLSVRFRSNDATATH